MSGPAYNYLLAGGCFLNKGTVQAPSGELEATAVTTKCRCLGWQPRSPGDGVCQPFHTCLLVFLPHFFLCFHDFFFFFLTPFTHSKYFCPGGKKQLLMCASAISETQWMYPVACRVLGHAPKALFPWGSLGFPRHPWTFF